jgi:sugar phosphate isomerase/epimerase
MTSRRDFTKTLSAAALGYAFRPLAPNPQPLAPSHKLDRIGLQLYTVRDRMAKDVDGTLAEVAAAGYREVEFAGYFGKSPQEIRAMLDRHGLAAPSGHISLTPAEQWRGALDGAHVVGHRYLVVAYIPAEARKTLDDWKRTAESFNRAGAEAKAAGVQFAYHNHDFEFASVQGRLGYDVLLAETDPKLVQLEMDLYWITKGGQDPLAYFARYPGRFPMVHVKDSMGPPENKMADVGAGTIDFKKIFAQRDQAGIRHFFVEHDQPADALASIRASCEYLKRLDF